MVVIEVDQLAGVCRGDESRGSGGSEVNVVDGVRLSESETWESREDGVNEA